MIDLAKKLGNERTLSERVHVRLDECLRGQIVLFSLHNLIRLVSRKFFQEQVSGSQGTLIFKLFKDTNGRVVFFFECECLSKDSK